MIVLKEINKIFHQNQTEDFYALKNINLSINDGEFLVLNGISGSGKSTLLSIMGGIMKPTSGGVEVDGENIASLSDFHLSNYRNKTVGFVTQSFYLFDEFSVKDNIMVPLVIGNLDNDEVLNRLNYAMDVANISHKSDQIVKNLSGGEKQRCVIARALVNNPQIILCDEPTANLDSANSLKFIEIMQKLKDMKKTVFIATHDPLFHDLACVDRVLNIKEGSLE